MITSGNIILFVTGLFILAVLSLSGLAYFSWRSDRHAARTPLIPIGTIADPRLREDLLAHGCGPCHGVPGSWLCICAGHCGSRRCRGAHVRWDLTGELESITRAARRA